MTVIDNHRGAKRALTSLDTWKQVGNAASDVTLRPASGARFIPPKARKKAPDAKTKKQHALAVRKRFQANQASYNNLRQLAETAKLAALRAANARDEKAHKSELRKAADVGSIANKVYQCRRRWSLRVHEPCGQYAPAVPFSCGDRVSCSHCAHARGQRTSKRVEALFAKVPAERTSLMTLTVKNTPTLSRSIFGELTDAKNRFMKLVEKRFPGAIRGGVVVYEVTYHPQGREIVTMTKKGRKVRVERWNEHEHWHPHIHMLIDNDYIDQDALSDLWCQATAGWGYVMDIRRVDNKRSAVAELCKYATKQVHLEGEALLTFRDAVRGRRMMTPFGSMFGVELEEEGDEEEGGDEEEPPCSCGLVGPLVEIESAWLTLAESITALVDKRKRGEDDGP